jgi:hypothetical protein
MKKIFSICTILLVTTFACRKHYISKISDGFESGKLSNIWLSDKFMPGDLEIQSAIVRSGNSAAKLTLHPGDQIPEEKGTDLERSEIMEARKYISVEDQLYTYKFSLFLPPDFPLDSTRLVIAQWKQDCKSGQCEPGNPIIALRYSSGRLNITLQTGQEKQVLYTISDDIRNKWLDFKFEIRFSRLNYGLIKAFLNNKNIIDYSGKTAYTEEYGYMYPGRFYFKTGLYRDKMDQIMTIYVDDFEKFQVIQN